MMRCASATLPGGRNCQRATFAWMAFCPSAIMACTACMSAFIRFMKRHERPTWTAINETTPTVMLQPSPKPADQKATENPPKAAETARISVNIARTLYHLVRAEIKGATTAARV